MCPAPLPRRPGKGPERRPELGARGAATGTARSEPEWEGRCGAGSKPDSCEPAPHPQPARSLASPGARQPAGHAPRPPRLRTPGKLWHTCALRPAPAARARQRGQREKGPGPRSLPLRRKWGGAFLLETRSGQARGGCGVRTAQAEGPQGGYRTLGQGGGAGEWPWEVIRVTSGPGQDHGGGGCGGRWEWAEPTPPLLCLGPEVSGQLQPGEERPPNSFTQQWTQELFYFFLWGGGHLGQEPVPRWETAL